MRVFRIAGAILGIAVALNLLTAAVSPAFAEEPPKVEMAQTEFHTLTSKDGVKYEIYVAFPLQYDPKSGGQLPVLYLVDGRGLFPMVASQAQTLGLEQEITPVILVGIDVSALTFIEGFAQRFTNLPPTRDLNRERELKQAYGKDIVTGRGEKFRQDIVDEIIPWIEARYPVTKERGLAGYSLGGLFTLHALFAAPEAFSKYLVGDPSLYWDNKVTLNTELEYSRRTRKLPAHVFLGFTEKGHGEHVGTVLNFVEALEERAYEGLEFDEQLFLDETHLSGIGAVFARGLTALYGQK